MDLAQVVQKDARLEQIEVHVRIEFTDPLGDFEHVTDMLNQPARVGVVSFHSRSGPQHFLDEHFVDQEALHQRPDCFVIDRQQDFADAVEELCHVLSGLELKVLHLQSGRVDAFDSSQNQLQTALVELAFTADPNEVARIEVRACFFGNIPHQPADGSGFISQLRQQGEIGVAVRTQLLVAQQKDLLNSVSILEFANKLPRHELAFNLCCAGMRGR